MRNRPGSSLLAALSALLVTGCGSKSSSSSGNLLGCSAPEPGSSQAASPEQVFALGTKKVGTSVPFTVPAGAASITIVEQLVSAPPTATFTDQGTLPNIAVPLSVTDANGAEVFNGFRNPPDPVQARLYFASNSPGTGTLTLPNTTMGLNQVASGLPSGTWSFVVSDLAFLCTQASNCASGGGNDASTYDVTVIVKPGGGTGNIPDTGHLDVTFNLTPGNITPPLSAATAGGDADMQRMVQSLGTLLGQRGIQLGTVKYVDVPSTMATKVASGVDVDDATACGELTELLATAPAGRQVNIFVVSNFVSKDVAPGTLVVGIDGSIPGPATISPTFQSGAAVSAGDLRFHPESCLGSGLALNCGPTGTLCCGADIVAYITAHEIGHYLGLYHVTEKDGTSFDPLQDTITCPCTSCTTSASSCANAVPAPASPHSMTVSECSPGTAKADCGGGDNLMFWVLGNASVGNLTDEQGRVMRANPAVY